ncbi:MAG: hypothetical protein EOO09_10615 [Chitinophagaceae bacterium]|nr:MAG: hypothetical protein EOO09_10615 [Chitinophagaceae bacterium]
MNQLFYNDQAHIAEEYQMTEDHLLQTSLLAFFKINSFKISLQDESFFASRRELQELLSNTLFNYTSPSVIMSELGFFTSEIEN